MAPIDIIIRMIESKKDEAINATVKAAKEDRPIMDISFLEGKCHAYQELIEDLEAFKKLFG